MDEAQRKNGRENGELTTDYTDGENSHNSHKRLNKVGQRNGLSPSTQSNAKTSVKHTWYDGGLMPERPEELEEGIRMGDTYGGAPYVGEKGKILTGSHGANGLRIIPKAKMMEYQRPPATGLQSYCRSRFTLKPFSATSGPPS